MNQEMLERSLRGFADRVGKVDDWTAPTPCADWDVRALVNHVVGELAWVPPLLEGKTIDEVGDALDGDLLGADPAAAYHSAMKAAIVAAALDGVRERTVHLSFGDVPGQEYLDQITSDVAIHSWDLARATGQDEALDGDLAGAVDDFLAPQAEQWRAAGAFGSAVETAEGAGTQERLLARTGRKP